VTPKLESVEPLLSLLARRPLGLLSDIDGTLAPIVPDPDAAKISDRCRELLRELVQRGVRLALVTGRDLDKAREMAGIEQAAYAANHGLTLWSDGQAFTSKAASRYVALARRVEVDAGGFGLPDVSIENKGPVIAFHYRRASDPEAARRRILYALSVSDAAREFAIQEGRMVVELRPPLGAHKGTAAVELARRLGLRAAVCLGDDTTDIDMFREVKRLREVESACVAVESEESVPEVLAAADYRVRGVEGVEWLLTEIVRALPATRP
jgi:trehalose 6-phosphate phosphatase